MSRNFIKSVCLVLGLTAAQHAAAFTLWGPTETWQTADLDYGTRYYYEFVDNDNSLADIENGAPKNFGEGSRLTTPIITYGFDDTFLEYFGQQGVAAVEAAMTTLNALPAASSANLNNFLTDGIEQINYSAQAMDLLDIKSTVMWLMAEHMGLLGETHVWDLAARAHYGTPACDYNYFVINRNYSPGTYDPTPYVNGRQYGYAIWDGCPVGIAVGDAIEIPTDTTQPRFTAVATAQGLQFGGYYLNMSADDVGGLQFLYKNNYYNYQGLDSNTVAVPMSSDWAPLDTNGQTGESNFFGLLGGVEKITFVRVNFDSLLNPGFAPITYHYSIPWVTNGHLTKLSVARTITSPDVLFTAAFLVNQAVPDEGTVARTGNFIQTTYVSVTGGVTPSTISASMVATFNNVGPIYYNENPFFMDSLNYLLYPIYNWGSFDGSTNAPIVYPTGFSLDEMEAEVLSGGAQVQFNEWAPVENPNSPVVAGAGGGLTPGGATTGGTGTGGGGAVANYK